MTKESERITKLFIELDFIGDPDDGMWSAYTGTSNGYGKRGIAVFSDERIFSIDELKEKIKTGEI